MRKQNSAPAAADVKDDKGTTPTPAPAASAEPAEGTKPAEGKADGDADPEPVPAPATAPAATPAPALSADRAEFKRFYDAFGADGAKWFNDGLSFELAQVQFTKGLRTQNDELLKKNAELSKKLGQVGKDGEMTPVGFDAGDAKKRTGFAGKIRVR